MKIIYILSLVILLVFHACDEQQEHQSQSKTVKELSCDQGFTLTIRDSAETRLVQVYFEGEILKKMTFVPSKNGDFRCNELLLVEHNDHTNILLNGIPVYEHCLSKDEKQSDSDHNPLKENIAQFIRTDLLKGDLSKVGKDERKFAFEEVELNDNNIPEYVVLPMSKVFCQLDGCLMYILDSKFKEISHIRVGAPPICIAMEKTNGYRDFIVYSGEELRIVKANTDGVYPTETKNLEILKGVNQGCQSIFGGGYPSKTYEY